MRLVNFDRSMCDNCGSCGSACMSKAVYLCGTDYTVAEVVERVVKDVAFFERSGGGVTISGGEPLSQPEFTLALLEECKKAGLHTALDTTGYVRWEVMQGVLPFTDLFLYDLKHMDSATHKQLTGVPNERILENARRVAAAGGRLQVRIPLITGMNDSAENVEAAGRFCSELGDAVTVVQLLPYHRLGSAKYKRLQRPDPMPPTDPPSSDEVAAHVLRLEALGSAGRRSLTGFLSGTAHLATTSLEEEGDRSMRARRDLGGSNSCAQGLRRGFDRSSALLTLVLPAKQASKTRRSARRINYAMLE